MLEIAIMLEGQNGLNWPRWKALVRQVEDLGFIGLYRSDHFTNSSEPDLDSLELWTSLTWLADHTTRLEFGPLVTPFSFRHPVFTARMAAAVDDLSGGRLTLGLGAGWQAREHHLFGFELLDLQARYDRFEEGLQVVTQLLQSATPVTFEGHYYQVREAQLLPHPQRPGGPRILLGGDGGPRMRELVAKYAAEWNGVFVAPQVYAARNQRLTVALLNARRDPATVKRSLMTNCVFGKDEAALREKLSARKRSLEELWARGLVAGNPAQVQEQLQALEEAGVQRIMLQWLELDDLAGLEALAKSVLSG